MKLRAKILLGCVTLAALAAVAPWRKVQRVEAAAAGPHLLDASSTRGQAFQGRLEARDATAVDAGGLNPTVVATHNGRLLLGPRPDGSGMGHAAIPALDEALQAEAIDTARTSEVLASARELMPSGARLLELDVRCTEAFCRIKMVRPLLRDRGWREIDRALVALSPDGEAMFNTESTGANSTGYLYFAPKNRILPLANRQDEDGESK